jgi:hypothetical protein
MDSAFAFAVSVGLALVVLYSFVATFLPSGEFQFIQTGLVVYLAVCMAAFVVVYRRAKTTRLFALGALALVLLAIAIEEIPATGQFLADRSTNPHKMGFQFDVETSLEIVVPIVVGVVVQWQWLMRRWLEARGERRLSRWPWVATILAAVVFLSPLGIEILKSAIVQSPTDWFAALWLMVALIAGGILIVIALVEYYIRVRKSRQVKPQPIGP